MVGLRKKIEDMLAVSTEYRRVTDGQTDILRRHSPRYAYSLRGNNKYSRTISLTLFTVPPVQAINRQLLTQLLIN